MENSDKIELTKHNQRKIEFGVGCHTINKPGMIVGEGSKIPIGIYGQCIECGKTHTNYSNYCNTCTAKNFNNIILNK